MSIAEIIKASDGFSEAMSDVLNKLVTEATMPQISLRFDGIITVLFRCSLILDMTPQTGYIGGKIIV